MPRRRQNNFCASSFRRGWRAGLHTNSMKSCCPLLLFAIAACLFASRRAGCGWGSSLGTPTASAGARFFAAPQGWGILVRHSRTARRSAELGACNLYRREQMRRHRRRTLPLLGLYGPRYAISAVRSPNPVLHGVSRRALLRLVPVLCSAWLPRHTAKRLALAAARAQRERRYRL